MTHLAKYREDMEEIAGQWNGDLPGIQEDRAILALEAMKTIDELSELFKELDY